MFVVLHICCVLRTPNKMPAQHKSTTLRLATGAQYCHVHGIRFPGIPKHKRTLRMDHINNMYHHTTCVFLVDNRPHMLWGCEIIKCAVIALPLQPDYMHCVTTTTCFQVRQQPQQQTFHITIYASLYTKEHAHWVAAWPNSFVFYCYMNINIKCKVLVSTRKMNLVLWLRTN